MMQNGLKQGECNSLDLAKFIAALIVVGIHQHPCDGDAYFYTWGIFGRLAVPFFFITSSFLFFLRQPDGECLRKYVVRLLKLYAFWFIATLPLTIHIRYNRDYGILLNILNFFRIFINDSTFRGSWFIMALIIAVPVVFLLGKKLKNWQLVILGITVEIFLQSYSYIKLFPQGIADAMTKFDVFFPDVHMSWLAAVVYVVFGKVIAEHCDQVHLWKRRTLRLLLVTAVLMMAARLILLRDAPFIGTPRTLLVLIVIPLIFLNVITTDLELNLPYKSIRKTSTIMYISHFILKLATTKILASVLHISLPLPVLYLAVVAESIILAAVIIKLQKLPKLQWLKYAW